MVIIFASYLINLLPDFSVFFEAAWRVRLLLFLVRERLQPRTSADAAPPLFGSCHFRARHRI